MERAEPLWRASGRGGGDACMQRDFCLMDRSVHSFLLLMLSESNRCFVTMTDETQFCFLVCFLCFTLFVLSSLFVSWAVPFCCSGHA